MIHHLLTTNCLTYHKLVAVFFFTAFFLLMNGQQMVLHAQVTDTTAVEPDSVSIQPDSVTVQPDSLIAQPDSLQQDALPPRQSQSPQRSGALKEGEVRFQATDSLVFDFREDRIANLYGSAKVTHQSGQLESGKVALNLDKNIVRANTQTPQDTLSQPVLTREGEPPVRSNKIAFNYETEKGRFEVARVEIDEGKLTGTKVKNVSPHVVFLEDAIYSTCKLDHPHYYIKMDQAKLVRNENGKEEVFFKNARLYILDIPYPIVFPFGYLPGNLSRRQSGLLQPTYVFQQTSERGLGLRNLGWFQYFNDYITGRASVDVYTSGTFFFDAQTTYRKRDKYSGSVQIGYSNQRGLEPTDPDFTSRVNKNIRVRHDQQFSPYSKLNANIEFRTEDFYKQNSYDIDERAQVSTSSNLNYDYNHPDGLYTFSASINQSQNFQTNVVTLTGPEFDFGLKRFSPFENPNTTSDNEPWYESLSVEYDNAFESEYRFEPIRGDAAEINWFEALRDPSKYRQATDNADHYQYGFRQDVNVSVNNLLNSRFLNLSANGRYSEFWYPSTIRKVYGPISNDTEKVKVPGFASAREFTTNLNFSTTFYGISNAKIGNLEGFRHTVRPNISFSYRPDFSSDVFGYFREVQVDSSGRTEEYSIFEDHIIGAPSPGEQQAINFGINNVFEAKQVKRDSTGEKNERVLRLIDQLSLNSSYNIAADSIKLADLSTSISSNVVSGLNLRASANFNFYDRDSLGRKVDDFLLTESRRIAELTNFRFTASTSFSGGDGRGIQIDDQPYFPARYDPYNQSIFNEMDPYFNSRPVRPLDSPWSVSINFSYSWSLSARPNTDNRRTATINAQNIQFQLTPKWSFSTRLGYDFIQKELTPSEFRLNRELHEWNLSFVMRPFGDFQYYSFRLSVNSSQIQSIFQKLPLLRNLERSSSPTGRGFGRSY